MNLFDNSDITGLLLTVVGGIMAVGAIVGIAGGITGDGGAADILGAVIVAIGGFFAAFVYLIYGNKIRTGEIKGKMDILANFVRIVGVTTIIVAMFSALGYAVQGIWSGTGTAIVKFLFGLLMVALYRRMVDEETTDKIVWIILFVLFLVCFLASFSSIFTGSVFIIIGTICYALVYLMMTVFMLDPDVKKRLGM